MPLLLDPVAVFQLGLLMHALNQLLVVFKLKKQVVVHVSDTFRGLSLPPASCVLPSYAFQAMQSPGQDVVAASCSL